MQLTVFGLGLAILLVATGCDQLGVGKVPQRSPEDTYIAYLRAIFSGDVAGVQALTIGGTETDRQLVMQRVLEVQLNLRLQAAMIQRFGESVWQDFKHLQTSVGGVTSARVLAYSTSADEIVRTTRAELRAGNLRVDQQGDQAIVYNSFSGKDLAFGFFRKTYRGWLVDLDRRNQGELNDAQLEALAAQYVPVVEALSRLAEMAEDPTTTLSELEAFRDSELTEAYSRLQQLLFDFTQRP